MKSINKEEKQLLLQALCARLPFKIKVKVSEVSYPVEFDVQMLAEIKNNNWYEYPIPYLCPMSSMTEEEYEELRKIDRYYGIAPLSEINDWEPGYKSIDWLLRHHFDFRGLISKGLAIEVTKENNPYKE